MRTAIRWPAWMGWWAGKPFDAVVMFKLLVLRHLYGLADEQVEFQVRDRYSFACFAGLSPKDTQARWTFKHGTKHCGYKNHISVDCAYKLVRRYDVTDAATHDSQRFTAVLDERSANRSVWADAAHRSQEREGELAARGFRSQLHRRGHKHQTLSPCSQQANRRKSRVRARVEHVFADQAAIGAGRRTAR